MLENSNTNKAKVKANLQLGMFGFFPLRFVCLMLSTFRIQSIHLNKDLCKNSDKTVNNVHIHTVKDLSSCHRRQEDMQPIWMVKHKVLLSIEFKFPIQSVV